MNPRSVNGTFATLAFLTLASIASAQDRAGMMDVGDASLRYEVRGSGPPLVFINGWALNYTAWDDQVAEFARDHRVIRYDLRGFGKSTGHADGTRDADDLRILLDSLGVSTTRVVGLSRGAMIAATFAVRWPQRVAAVVLYGMGPPVDFPIQPNRGERQERLEQVARDHGVDSLKLFIGTLPLAWVPPDRPDIVAKTQRTLADYDARDLLDRRPPSNRVARPTLAELSRLSMPVLLVHGDHETPRPREVADTLARRIPGARRVVIANGGHGAHMAQPEAFNRELRAFFERVPRTR